MLFRAALVALFTLSLCQTAEERALLFNVQGGEIRTFVGGMTPFTGTSGKLDSVAKVKIGLEFNSHSKLKDSHSFSTVAIHSVIQI